MFPGPIPAEGAERPAAPAHHAATPAFPSIDRVERIDIGAHACRAGAEVPDVCEEDAILDHLPLPALGEYRRPCGGRRDPSRPTARAVGAISPGTHSSARIG